MLAALGRCVIALGLLGTMVTAVGLVSVLGKPDAAPVAGPLPKREIEPAQVRPGATAPSVQKPVPEPGSQTQDSGGLSPVRKWANKVATVVDIPARALVSYVRADLAMSEYQQDCRLSWATLAGIGRVESDHGRYGDRTLGEDAVPSRPIIGVPLDGGPNVRAIRDTDNGALDGDPVYDRAVGPMQFIPSTWEKWATDGNGDGVGDPQNLDDAATAAARYLCAGGRDMSSGQGWWAGVMSYNNSVEYARKVYALAETYAEASNRRQ